MELSAAEQAVVERMRMTPQERQAEIEARRQERLDALTPEQRQALEEREARIAAMTAPQRRAYLAGQRLAGIARAMRRDAAKGVGLAEALAAVDPVSKPDVDWLVGELKKVE
jgi:ABC-type lipopolysaccharide export system ATPase subunit